MPKAYVFDQDGTLYPRDSRLYRVTSQTTKEWLIKRLDIDRFDAEQLLYKKLPLQYPNSLNGFASLGLTVEDYHTSVFNITNVSRFLVKDQKLIETLSTLNGVKCLMTFSSEKFSKQVLDILGVSHIFEMSLFAKDLDGSHDKIVAYEKIRTRYGLEPSDICIVGDNLHVDLLDAQSNGYMCVLVSPENFEEKCDILVINSIYELTSLSLN